MRHRLGLLVYGTDTGLGTQTRSLYNHLQPTKTMLVNLGSLNGLAVHEDWYRYDIRTTGYPSNEEVADFLRGLDVVFLCESPLNYYLIEEATRRNIRTIIQPNPEFSNYLVPPRPPLPTVFALPTSWFRESYQALPGCQVVELPVPIDTTILPQRRITEARRFFHIAGRPALHDRNGTLDFIAAVERIEHSIEADFILYCQAPNRDILTALADSRIRHVTHVPTCEDLYRDGDVLILPRRYGGLCLPCQEAIGAGIPVLMPDVSPNNDWLPGDWLIPISRRVEHFTARCEIPLCRVRVNDLAERMVELYQNPGKVAAMAVEARQLGRARSWQTLKPSYLRLIYETRQTNLDHRPRQLYLRTNNRFSCR